MRTNLATLLAALVLFTGCTNAAYFVASEAYKKQPTVRNLKFSGITGKYSQLKFNINNYKYDKDKIFIALASSGGGYRASFITLGVLLEFERLTSPNSKKNLLNDIDLYSTVSGSGLTVGYYLSHLYNNTDFDLNKNIESILEHDLKTHKENALRTNLDKMLFNQDKQKIQSHIKNLLRTDKGQLKLRDIFIDNKDTKKSRIPLWLINATIFQNMEGISITPNNLEKLGVDKNRSRLMNVSEAIMASMAYPMAIPPLQLESKSCGYKCYIYLVDGGIYDSTGIMPILAASKQAKNHKKLLIIIDSSENMTTPFSKSSKPPNPFDMLEKLPSMVTENQSQRARYAVNLLPKDTKAVILRASNIEGELGITTRLNASLNEQKKLIEIGRNLVRSSNELKRIITEWK